MTTYLQLPCILQFYISGAVYAVGVVQQDRLAEIFILLDKSVWPQGQW